MITHPSSRIFSTIKHSLSVGLSLLLLMLSFLAPPNSKAQAKSPYSRDRLLTAIRTNAKTGELSTQQLVEYIQQRGVDFEMTTPDEARFRAAGAAEDLIVAIRRNYRPVLPAGSGALIISSTVAGCSVFLNGQLRGVTDQGGALRLRPLKAGQYKIIVKKDGYEEQQRATTISIGAEMVERFTMIGVRGMLTVSTNIIGAEVRLDGVEYPTGIASLSLPPGTYELRVSKQGFRTFMRTVAISPGQPITAEARLEPMPIDELLAQVVSHLQANRYPQAIAAGREILTSHPDNPRANLLTGIAYYDLDDYSTSGEFLAKAIALGEQVRLPIKHHHAGLSDGLCTGTITIGQGILAFTSTDKGEHSFSVPASKIYEVTPEPNKFGRVHVRIGVQNGAKEDKKTFNFQVSHAFLYKANPNDALVFVRCNNCGQETTLIYQLIKQLKDNPVPLVTAPPLESNANNAPRPTLFPRTSSGYRSYNSPGKFKLDFPENWNEVESTDQGALLAPEGAYTRVGARYNFSNGIQFGTVPVRGLPLPQAVEQLVGAILKDSSYLKRLGGNQSGDIKGRAGLSVPLGGKSPITQRDEFVLLYAVMMKNGDLFYLLAVGPRDEASVHSATFGKILGSIEFLD